MRSRCPSATHRASPAFARLAAHALVPSERSYRCSGSGRWHGFADQSYGRQTPWALLRDTARSSPWRGARSERSASVGESRPGGLGAAVCSSRTRARSVGGSRAREPGGGVVRSATPVGWPWPPAIPGKRKSKGTKRRWARAFLRLSGYTGEREPVYCPDAPVKDVNL